MHSRSLTFLLVGFFLISFFNFSPLTVFGQEVGEEQQLPEGASKTGAETKSTVVADVNVGDVQVEKQSDGVKGSFQLLGKLGQQNDIVYGVVALDESGAMVDIKPLGKDVSVKQGENKTLSFDYTYPSFLTGSVTIWLRADTSRGLLLGMQKVLTQSFPARATAFTCTDEATSSVTCRHRAGGQVALALYDGSILDSPVEEKTITVEAGALVATGTASKPGQYTVVARDVATQELATFPFVQAGAYGKVENVVLSSEVGGEVKGVVLATASPRQGAHITMSLVSPSGKNCSTLEKDLEGSRVAEFTFKTDCLAGSATVVLKSADGDVLDTVHQEYSVEPVGENQTGQVTQPATSTQVEKNTPWYRWLLYGLLVVIIGAIAYFRSRFIIRKASRPTQTLLWIGLILTGWTWQTHSAAALTLVTETWGPNGCGACNVAFSASANVNTDKGTYAPGETITITSTLNLSDAGDNGIGATERARTSVARRAPATFDVSDFPSGLILSSIGNTSKSSLPVNAGPNQATVTAPSTTGPHYLRIRLIITSETSGGVQIDYRESLGNLGFSVATPTNCVYNGNFGWGAGTNNVVGSDCQVFGVNANVVPGNTMTFTDSDASGSGYMGSITLRCNAGPSDISLVSSTCSAAPAPESGSCGSADGQTYSLSAPAIANSARCSSGTYDTARWNPDGGAWYTTTTFPAGAAPFNTGGAQAAYYLGRFWSCDGINGGSTVGCRLYYQPECGSANGSGPLSSAPGNTTALEKRALCNVGTASSVATNPSSYNWSCTNGAGPTANCSASRSVAVTAPTATITSTGPVALGEPSLWERVVSWVTGRDHVALANHQNTTITAGQNARIDWSSTNADSCSIDQGIGSVAPNASGNLRLTGLSVGTHTYTITCRKSGQTDATHSTTIIVNAAAVTPPGAPGAGGAGDFINATPGACNSGTINVDWNNESGATYYEIERDGGSALSTGSSSSYTHSGLSANSSHSYRARACNTSGCSGWSSTANANAPSSCAAINYQIVASAGMGGSISPSGTVSGIPAGANRTFTITASATFSIANVVVDGVSVGAVGSYTFSNINADHTIVASFSGSSSPSLTLTASDSQISTGGSVTISWVTANVVTCDAWGGDGSWDAFSPSPAGGTSLRSSVSPPVTYRMQCWDGGGVATGIKEVTVGLLPVFTDITVCPNPATVEVGSTLQMIAYAHNGIFDCTNPAHIAAALNVTNSATWTDGGDPNLSISNIVGTKGLVTGLIVGSESVRATYPALGFDTQSVTVTPAAAVLPTVNLTIRNTTTGSGPSSAVTASPGDNLQLDWSVANATGCTASGKWSGAKSTTGGSETDTAVIPPGAYVLDCVNASGTTTKQVTINFLCTASVSSWGACGPPCAGGNGTRSRTVTTAGCVVTTETESCTTTVCRDLNWKEVAP